MKPKVIRISTVPLSLHLLLQGQLKMLAETYEVLAVSSSGEELHKVAEREGVRTCAIPMERHIAPLKDLIALIRLIILFRKEKPQIVHSLTPKAGLLAMMAARICRVPKRITKKLDKTRQRKDNSYNIKVLQEFFLCIKSVT